MLEPALRYAHAAEDTDAVTGFFEQLVLPTYYSGGVATVQTWLDWYDDELRARYPTIAVLGAWVYALTGRPAEAARCEREAQASTATPALPDGSPSLEPWIATLRAYTCPDGVERTLADCKLALEQLGPGGWWQPIAQLGAGSAHALLGDAAHAVPALVRATELAAAVGAHESENLAFAQLALLAIEAGAWEDAATYAGRAIAIVMEAKLDTYLASGLAYAAAARVAIHRGEQTPAREYIAAIHRLRPLLNQGLPWVSVQIGLELTRLHLALEEAPVAGTVLSEAERILRVRPGSARWSSWPTNCANASPPHRPQAASGR
jgi:LuxR family transcriptional regulator, maltose regulon positive regulatory protein